MTKEQVKKQIKKKFKTLSNFARCAGIDRTRLQVIFARDTRPTKEEIQALADQCKTTEYRETGNLVDHEKVEALRGHIEAAGGVYRFGKDNPQFPTESIYLILNGTRKRHSKLVQSLFDHFKI
jgi:hypothetical protein